MGVEHVYESPKNEVGVTSPSNSARSSRLSNGFFRDSGNDTMYTSSGKTPFNARRGMKKLTKMHFCHEIIKTGGARGGKMALDIKRVA